MFIFPLEGENPTRHTHYVLWGIIAVCCALFIAASVNGRQETFQLWGYVPASSTSADILTSMFLHAGYWHLVGNMLFLWMFGDNIEDVVGDAFFLVCYLLCGVVATLTYAGIHPESAVPLVGASGAISGMAGMYAVFFPKVSADLIMFILYWEVHRIKTTILAAVGFWFCLQVALGMVLETTSIGNYVRIAFSAHVGGFIAGVVLGLLFVKVGYVARYMRNGKRHWLLGYVT